MGGPGDPWSLQQQAWGSPFKCFQLWQGCGETLHCKSLKKTELWKEREKKKKKQPSGPEWLLEAWPQICEQGPGSGSQGLGSWESSGQWGRLALRLSAASLG